MKKDNQWILVTGAGVGVFMLGAANMLMTTGINKLAVVFVGVLLASFGYIMYKGKFK